LLNDDPEPFDHEVVDFAAYGKVTPAGMERPPRDIDEPRLWTSTNYAARFLSDKKSQARYHECPHTGSNAFLGRCASTAVGEGLEA
jgi:hypothetical protein